MHVEISICVELLRSSLQSAAAARNLAMKIELEHELELGWGMTELEAARASDCSFKC